MAILAESNGKDANKGRMSLFKKLRHKNKHSKLQDNKLQDNNVQEVTLESLEESIDSADNIQDKVVLNNDIQGKEWQYSEHYLVEKKTPYSAEEIDHMMNSYNVQIDETLDMIDEMDEKYKSEKEEARNSSGISVSREERLKPEQIPGMMNAHYFAANSTCSTFAGKNLTDILKQEDANMMSMEESNNIDDNSQSLQSPGNVIEKDPNDSLGRE